MPYESAPLAIRLNELVVSLDAYMWLMWFDELTPAEQAFIAIWELQQEVYNGGFMQYFQNSSGERVPHICEILRRIDAGPAASVIERAISLAGPDIPWNDKVRRFSALKTISEDNRDKLFHMSKDLFDQSDDLHRLLFQYLSKHREQIEAPADFWTEGAIQ